MGLHQNSFFLTKATINQMKGQPIDWEKIFVSHVSDKG
jgi:hypothetical protein